MALHGTGRKYAVVHINNQGLEPVVLGLMQWERKLWPSLQTAAHYETDEYAWMVAEREDHFLKDGSRYITVQQCRSALLQGTQEVFKGSTFYRLNVRTANIAPCTIKREEHHSGPSTPWECSVECQMNCMYMFEQWILLQYVSYVLFEDRASLEGQSAY